MNESLFKAPWLEPHQAATSMRQLVMYQCALTEGYIHWSLAQTTLALTATSPVEYLSKQARLGATLRQQLTDRFSELAGESKAVFAPTPAAVAHSPSAATLPVAVEAVTAAPPLLPESSALSPGLAAVLPKLRKANINSAKNAVSPEPVKPPPANGSLRPLSASPSLSVSRSHAGNGAGAARSASLAAQESLRQKIQRARKSSQKTSSKRVSD